jgi:polyphosphate kinase 2 (PPK2 family)
MMVAGGFRIAKIFLHITPAEQIRRFKDRLTNPLKRWKLFVRRLPQSITQGRLRAAIEDMMEKTSPKWAPWYLIRANDKLYGRLATFTILIEVLSKGLILKPSPLDPKLADMAKQLFDLPRT